MDSIILGGLLALGAAVATGIGTYVVARRRTSGRIDTTDAATLWSESQQMRAELRAEVLTLRAEAANLRAEVIRLNGRVQELTDEIRGLRARLGNEEGPIHAT